MKRLYQGTATWWWGYTFCVNEISLTPRLPSKVWPEDGGECDQRLEEACWEVAVAPQATAASWRMRRRASWTPVPLSDLSWHWLQPWQGSREEGQVWQGACPKVGNQQRLSTPAILSFSVSPGISYCRKKRWGCNFLNSVFKWKVPWMQKSSFGDWLNPLPKSLCQEILRDCLPFWGMEWLWLRVPGCSSLFLQGYGDRVSELHPRADRGPVSSWEAWVASLRRHQNRDCKASALLQWPHDSRGGVTEKGMWFTSQEKSESWIVFLFHVLTTKTET